jgi:signal transduction histidine kinase
MGVVALGFWAQFPGGASLAVASLGLVAGAFWARARTRVAALGFVVLLGGILAGYASLRQTDRISSDWEAYWADRQERIGALLDERLEERLLAAESAADELARLASAELTDDRRETLARDLRRRHGISALALYDPQGNLTLWDGVHRGRVPEEAQRGLRRYAFGELPLFGYLYVTAPAAGAGTAVAAVLLRTDLPGPLATGAGDFASEFRAQVGEDVEVVAAGSPGAAGGWDLRLGDRVLFTVVLDPPTREERVQDIESFWRVVVSILTLVAWILLAVGGPSRAAAGLVAALTLMALAVVLPLDRLPGLESLFDPGSYHLPGLERLSLGRFTAFVLSAATVVSLLSRPRSKVALPMVAGAVALAYPLALGWIAAAPTADALVGSGAAWVAHQGSVVILLTLVTGWMLLLGREGSARPHGLLVAMGLAMLFGATSGFLVRSTAGIPFWWYAAWGIPAWLAVRSLGGRPGWQKSLVAWGMAGVLAGTAGIPSAWSHRVEARMLLGGDFLRRIAEPDDAAVQEALLRLGRTAVLRSEAGGGGVDLLYGAWRQSGLAELGVPAWLTLWSPAGIPEEELRVGVSERPLVALEVQEDRSPGPPVRVVRFERDDARYVLRVALTGGETLTAAAPPFADPAHRTPLSPLLAGGAMSESTALTLIPAPGGESGDDGELRWIRTARGWQGELFLRFPNGESYRGHYAIDLPGHLLALARASLLLVLNLAAFMAFWLIGRAILREPAPPELRLGELVISFRARVTLALFGFFLLANALFGTLAYRTISGTSHRAAQVLAERVAEDASGWYLEVGGRMQALARRVGVELLEYRGGELREGSMDELVELGLYEGWIPMRVFRLLDGRKGVREITETAMGSWEYVTAFRRLPDGDILAAQVPLQAGATAIGSSDVAELLGFAVLVGAALSLVLALLVGRTLTRPIHALQVASERVGAGNLGLRLPADRRDEFGAVFRAFNRMVGRLRRARRQLVRTTRRTQAIMEEAAVGMVALDPAGRVTLVNPRAEGLLGADVAVGEPLSVPTPLGQELKRWLGAFLASEDQEAIGELHVEAERFRVRARRLGQEGASGGAVVALENVTDELRTERVLAWGEMARQVAHEVKNPLTPIKLSIQHIRRAWDDGSPEFGKILERNADAMLAEIDRLATIAKTFSRFGAPQEPGSSPLEPVDAGRVVEEVMRLYGATEGGVAFEVEVQKGLPRVQARVSELKEALINLLENARAAMREGGRVAVRVIPGQLHGSVEIRVVDQGSGIPEDLMPKVFEPHFSTRTTGTGLGLAIVRRLVESWGGVVSLESTAGEGTTVTLIIPAWE